MKTFEKGAQGELIIIESERTVVVPEKRETVTLEELNRKKQILTNMFGAQLTAIDTRIAEVDALISEAQKVGVTK